MTECQAQQLLYRGCLGLIIPSVPVHSGARHHGLCDQQPVDPFSVDREEEAVRRGRELKKSGKRAPVLLVSEKWPTFLDVNHRRTMIDRRWKAAAEALRRTTDLRDDRVREFGETMAWARGKLEALCPAEDGKITKIIPADDAAGMALVKEYRPEN